MAHHKGVKRRIETPDTLDAALRLLMGLQADGWGLRGVDLSIEYGHAGAKTRSIPVEAVLVIRLSAAG